MQWNFTEWSKCSDRTCWYVCFYYLTIIYAKYSLLKCLKSTNRKTTDWCKPLSASPYLCGRLICCICPNTKRARARARARVCACVRVRVLLYLRMETFTTSSHLKLVYWTFRLRIIYSSFVFQYYSLIFTNVININKTEYHRLSQWTLGEIQNAKWWLWRLYLIWHSK